MSKKKVGVWVILLIVLGLAILDILLNSLNLIIGVGPITETTTEIIIELISGILVSYGLLKRR